MAETGWGSGDVPNTEHVKFTENPVEKTAAAQATQGFQNVGNPAPPSAGPKAKQGRGHGHGVVHHARGRHQSDDAITEQLNRQELARVTQT